MRNIGLLLVSAVFLTALSACSDIEEGLADSTPSAPAYRIEISDEGVVGTPTAVPGNGVSISYPALAGDHQKGVFVAWTEPNGQGGSQIVMARGRRGR